MFSQQHFGLEADVLAALLRVTKAVLFSVISRYRSKSETKSGQRV